MFKHLIYKSTLPVIASAGLYTFYKFSTNPSKDEYTFNLLSSINKYLPLVYAENLNTQVYAWGSNSYGQLGKSGVLTQSVPSPIQPLDHASVSSIVVDTESVMAITQDGKVYTWGFEEEYCLGTGRNFSSSCPTQINLPPIIQGSLCPTHGCAIDTFGRLWVWGTRALGIDFAQDKIEEKKYIGLLSSSAADPRVAGQKQLKYAPTPVMVDSSVWDNVPVRHVACGLNHTIFALEDGRVFGMGSNYEGALGLGDEFDVTQSQKSSRRSQLHNTIDKPVEIKALRDKNVKQLCSGKRYTLALTESGDVYAFGEDSYGQLGLPDLDNNRYQREPRRILGDFQYTKIAHISAGDSHAAAVDAEGKVYIWGLGRDGQLGNGLRAFKNTSPVLNTELQAQNVVAVKVSCGDGHTCVLDKDGQIWLFGRGSDGQLGRGVYTESTAASRTVPVKLDLIKENLIQKPYDPKKVRVIDIALGSNSSFALVRRF